MLTRAGGTGGGSCPPLILKDQLTLFQPGGQITPTTLILKSPGFSDLPPGLLKCSLLLLEDKTKIEKNQPYFGRSINPISTRGGILCLAHYYLPTQLYVASIVPTISVELAVMDRL